MHGSTCVAPSISATVPCARRGVTSAHVWSWYLVWCPCHWFFRAPDPILLRRLACIAPPIFRSKIQSPFHIDFSSIFEGFLLQLGHLGSNLGGLGAILAPTWGILGPTWGILEPTWGILRPTWGILEPFCLQIWAQVGLGVQFCRTSKNLLVFTSFGRPR